MLAAACIFSASLFLLAFLARDVGRLHAETRRVALADVSVAGTSMPSYYGGQSLAGEGSVSGCGGYVACQTVLVSAC